MLEFDLEKQRMWGLQRECRDIAEALYSDSFYSDLRRVLNNETWRRYETEAFGRVMEFEALPDFLTHRDGLGWPSIQEVLTMISTVAKGTDPFTGSQGAPGEFVRQKAGELLEALAGHGIALDTPAERVVKPLLNLPEEATFAPEGRPSKEAEGNLDIVQVSVNGGGGNAAAYLAARLKKANRDDLLEEIGPGKRFKSVRAAAIEAGIVKAVPTVRITSPEAVATRLIQHLPPDDLARLVALLTEHLLP